MKRIVTVLLISLGLCLVTNQALAGKKELDLDLPQQEVNLEELKSTEEGVAQWDTPGTSTFGTSLGLFHLPERELGGLGYNLMFRGQETETAYPKRGEFTGGVGYSYGVYDLDFINYRNQFVDLGDKNLTGIGFKLTNESFEFDSREESIYSLGVPVALRMSQELLAFELVGDLSLLPVGAYYSTGQDRRGKQFSETNLFAGYDAELALKLNLGETGALKASYSQQLHKGLGDYKRETQGVYFGLEVALPDMAPITTREGGSRKDYNELLNGLKDF